MQSDLYILLPPIPAPARFMAWNYGRSLAEIAGSNPAGGVEACLLWVLSGRGSCVGLMAGLEESSLVLYFH
jgi:hypothetical protein